MNLNLQTDKTHTYDAIVIGSGISGGWAAKELCEKGLKTLVLERGMDIKHPNYPHANSEAWEVPNNGKLTNDELKDYDVQKRTNYLLNQYTKHTLVKDTENPYTEVKRFDWIRGYQVGGRSLLWGRQSYRLSDLDFEANLRDGIAVDWPIRYKDIASWYSYVESFAGINGRKEGLAHLPDGEFLPPMDLNCLEQHLSDNIRKNYSDRILTIGRSANLTVAHKGRGKCQYRNRCSRGCPYGAYFSSNASTIPAAAVTGNMTLRPHSIVHELMYDKDTKRASGVRIIDAETNETKEFFAKIIFVNASALGTTQILLNSTSDRFPNGFGNDSGVLGKYLMDHHFQAGAWGEYPGFNDKYYSGRRPNGIYVPRFRNLDKKTKQKDFIRGYGYQGGASRQNWRRSVKEMSFGGELKDALMYPGGWSMGLGGFGETLPYEKNTVTLNRELTDKWGLPTLTIDCEFGQNELNMREDMKVQGAEMLEAAGFKNITTYDRGMNPGLAIHEMGTARMGRDPKTSVLNEWNQVHSAKNVFVTDGACMTSNANQNPSLTYMALTARAADYAVKELNRQNL